MKYVIIGSSAAGISALQTLIKIDSNSEVVCLSQEKEFPYNKCFLADYFSKSTEESSLYLKPNEFFQDSRISLLLNTEVVQLRPKEKEILTAAGKSISYDKLLLATGSSPIIPKISGSENVKGIFTFHALRDTVALQNFIDTYKVQNAIVIGAGLTGLECADALQKNDISVSVINKSDYVLSSLITPSMAEFIQQKMKEKGIDCLNNESVVSISNTNGLVSSVLLASGKNSSCDLIVFACGSQPNTTLAMNAGIITDNKAIVTNEYLQTSISDIYAAGDIMRAKNIFSGMYMRSCMWPDAMLQGRIAAMNMAGKEKTYPGIHFQAESMFFGLDFFACGKSIKEYSTSHLTIKKDLSFYHGFGITQSYLESCVLIGNCEEKFTIRKLIQTKQSISEIL